VQSWFEDLFNWIGEAATGAVKALASLIPGWVKDWFEQAFQAIEHIGYEAWKLTEEWTEGIPEPVRSIFRVILLPAGVGKKVFEDVLLPNLNWLWNQITSGLEDAKNAITTAFDGAFSAVADTFKNALSGLAETFKPVVEFFTNLLKPLVDPIIGALTGVYDFFTKDIPKAFSDFYSWLKSGWEGFLKALGEFSGMVGDFFNGIYAFFTKELPDILKDAFTWIFQRASEIAGAIVKLIKPVADAVYSIYRDFVKAVTSGLTESIKPGSPEKEVKQQIENLIKEMNKRVKELAEKSKKGSPIAEAFVASVEETTVAVLAGSEVAEIMGAAADAAHPIKTLQVREKIKDFIGKIGVDRLTTGVLMGWATYGALPLVQRWWRKQFRPTLPSEGDLRTWYLRGYSKEEEVRELLAEHGYSDGFIDNMIKSWQIIPGVSDLITFVVREVITPEDFYKWSAMQGLSDYWAKNYWEAHWVLPSFSDLREAFWRGIISEAEFKKYIVWHDYKPEPRPGISKSDQEIMAQLSYRLPGRMDARWMLRWGIINRSDLEELTKAEGMHPQWIPKVAEAEYLNQLLDERSRVKSEYQSSFAKGMITRETLEAKLREVKFIDDEIKYLLDASDEARRRELRTMALKTLEQRWKRGKITRSEFEENARVLGLDADYIKAYADQVEASLREVEKVDLTKDERKSYASFLIRKYKAGYMTEEELQRRLEALELTPDEIELRMRNASEEYEFEVKEMLKDAYIAAYRKEQIDESKLQELLTSLGLRSDYVAEILTAEKYRKKVERVEVETLSDRLEKLRAQEKQQLLYIQDLQTDLEAKERIYNATQALWNERIKRLQDEIAITTDPAKRSALEAKLRELEINANMAITRAEETYVNAKEKIERASARLDEIRREIETVQKAMSA
jgi:phage-related protein